MVTAHGFDRSVNGLEVIYNTTGAAASGLVNGNAYYIRYVNDNQLSFHSSFAQATNNDDVTRVKITVAGGTGVQSFTDAAYDDTLAGFFLSDEAMPRESIVRRQGDTMTGAR